MLFMRKIFIFCLFSCVISPLKGENFWNKWKDGSWVDGAVITMMSTDSGIALLKYLDLKNEIDSLVGAHELDATVSQYLVKEAVEPFLIKHGVDFKNIKMVMGGRYGVWKKTEDCLYINVTALFDLVCPGSLACIHAKLLEGRVLLCLQSTSTLPEEEKTFLKSVQFLLQFGLADMVMGEKSFFYKNELSKYKQRVISNIALTGLYVFMRSKDFSKLLSYGTILASDMCLNTLRAYQMYNKDKQRFDLVIDSLEMAHAGKDCFNLIGCFHLDNFKRVSLPTDVILLLSLEQLSFASRREILEKKVEEFMKKEQA